MNKKITTMILFHGYVIDIQFFYEWFYVMKSISIDGIMHFQFKFFFAIRRNANKVNQTTPWLVEM